MHLRSTHDHEQSQDHDEDVEAIESSIACRARPVRLELMHPEQSGKDEAEWCKAQRASEA